MADREVSWGDEEEVFEAQPVPVAAKASVPVPKIQEKKAKEPMATPEWSIDTRGDLPIERSFGSNERRNQATPGWPEEEAQTAPANSYENRGGNNNNNGRNYANGNDITNESLPPLTRRVGRDPVPAPGEFRENRAPREYREPRGGNDSNSAPAPGPRRSRIDDLSTLNLPGVDLSKMPSSSTPLHFPSSNNNSRRESREPREQRDDRDRNDSYDKVNRVTREVEEMGWGDESAAPSAPVASSSGWGNEPARTIEPARASYAGARLDDNGRRDEPEPVKVAEPFRQSEPARQSAPIKAINTAARLDDDGWGDEPEQPAQIAEPVRVSETVRASEPIRQPEPARNPQPEDVSAKKLEFEPVKVVPSASAEAFVPAAQAPPPMMTMTPAYPHQFAQMSHMMSPHSPMSPVGQMPMSVPMSCMPGMMMPFWVTCPFCYHCYMYPPVVPGSGPAPGATTLHANTQLQQQ